MTEGSEQASLVSGRWVLRAVLAVMFACALAVRWDAIARPPLDFHPTRQLRSAQIARALYARAGGVTDVAQLAVIEDQMKYTQVLELPFMESLAAGAYLLAGGEHLWIPRALAALFWVLGGLPLFLLARRLVSADGALLSLAFYLFSPFAVAASRSFQPDPLMIALLIASLWAIVGWGDVPTRTAMLRAVVLSAAAVLVKPMAVFPLAVGFGAVALLTKRTRSIPVWTAGVLLPALLVYGSLMLRSPLLNEQAGGSFLPALLARPSFYQGWLTRVLLVVGFPSLVGGLVGLAIFRERSARTFVLALWGAYVAYGLVFNYHIHTHDYYSLPLIPVVALSLAPLGQAIATAALARFEGANRCMLIAVAVFALAVILGTQHYRNTTGIQTKPANWNFAEDVRRARAIGDATNHSTRVLYLDLAYGVALRYYGMISGEPWPTTDHQRADRLMGGEETTPEARFDALSKRVGGAEYFVVTDLNDFEQQGDLRLLLESRGRLLSKDDGYLLYDLR